MIAQALTQPTTGRLPTTGKRSFGNRRTAEHVHQGVDIFPPTGMGTPVYSMTGGTVTHAANKLATGFSGYGRHVVVRQSADGPWFLYAHLARAMVKPGDAVEAGQQIGTVGASCFSRTSPLRLCGGGKAFHLHFEVSPTRYGTAARPGQDSEAPRLDPVAWLENRAGITAKPTDGELSLGEPRSKPGKRVLLGSRPFAEVSVAWLALPLALTAFAALGRART